MYILVGVNLGGGGGGMGKMTEDDKGVGEGEGLILGQILADVIWERCLIPYNFGASRICEIAWSCRSI